MCRGSLGKARHDTDPGGRQDEEDAILKHIRSGQRVEHFENVPAQGWQFRRYFADYLAIRTPSEKYRRFKDRPRHHRAQARGGNRPARQQEFRDFVENASLGMHRLDATGSSCGQPHEMEMLFFRVEEYIGRHMRNSFQPPLIEDILQADQSRNAARLRSAAAPQDGSVRHVSSVQTCCGRRQLSHPLFHPQHTERRRAEGRIATLPEKPARAKHVLATVQATVHLTRRHAGRSQQAIAAHPVPGEVHQLFVESRWAEPSCAISQQDLGAYCG